MNVHLRSCIWLILLCTALSCKTTPDASTVFTKENLVTQLFTINTQADTTIATADGIQITIPANAILAPKASVTLVIKEALSLSDIIQAGLTTQTKRDILSSGGMFYISTEEISFIIKPLQIKVPAAYADTAMRLYKGVTDEDRIKWDAPEPVVVSQSEAIQEGQKLFEQNCRSCHDLAKKHIGPALANVENRWEDRKLLFKWIKNTNSVLQDGDPYANCLYCEYNKTAMPSFYLEDNEIEEILAFIERETIRLHLKADGKSYIASDSIRYYQHYYMKLKAKRALLLGENENKVNNDISDSEVTEPVGEDIDTSIKDTVVKASASVQNAEFYQLTVKTYGWYNIDALLNDLDVVKSHLVVRMNGNYSQGINVYLVIPEYKVFTHGLLLDDGKNYGFYSENGDIYLPQSENAFIIAAGEEKGKLFYGQQQFVTAVDQIIDLSVTTTSETDIKVSIKKLELDKVADISAKEVVRMDNLKQIEAELSWIRRMGIIRDCFETDTSTYPVSVK